MFFKKVEMGGDPSRGSTKSLGSRCSQSKSWVFTVNSYTEKMVEQIAQVLGELSEKYTWAFQRENEGTPHLQGFIIGDKRFRPSELKLPFRWTLAHWEKMKGDFASNDNYCTDEDKRDIGPWAQWVWSSYRPKRKLKLIDPNYQWEKDILDIVAREPSERLIYWVWSEKGKMGKTAFCKYLVAKHGACVLHGKGADIRNGLAQWISDKNRHPDIVVYPIPRCFSLEYISYEGLENIKDMFFYSGKYEGGQVCGPPPHLFVFANTGPDESKMSSDRWVIINID